MFRIEENVKQNLAASCMGVFRNKNFLGGTIAVAIVKIKSLLLACRRNAWDPKGSNVS